MSKVSSIFGRDSARCHISVIALLDAINVAMSDELGHNKDTQDDFIKGVLTYLCTRAISDPDPQETISFLKEQLDAILNTMEIVHDYT